MYVCNWKGELKVKQVISIFYPFDWRTTNWLESSFSAQFSDILCIYLYLSYWEVWKCQPFDEWPFESFLKDSQYHRREGLRKVFEDSGLKSNSLQAKKMCLLKAVDEKGPHLIILDIPHPYWRPLINHKASPSSSGLREKKRISSLVVCFIALRSISTYIRFHCQISAQNRQFKLFICNIIWCYYR